MSGISPRVDAALDDAIERLCKVMLRWAEDSRGPSQGWVASLSASIAVLVDARARWGDARAALAAATQPAEPYPGYALCDKCGMPETCEDCQPAEEDGTP